jgi:hypothetical protein
MKFGISLKLFAGSILLVLCHVPQERGMEKNSENSTKRGCIGR